MSCIDTPTAAIDAARSAAAVNCRTSLICLLMLATQGFASEWQDPASIQAAAERYAERSLDGYDSVKILASGVDQRIRLPRCDRPLEASAPRGLSGGQGVVSVACASPQSWQLYVPVRASFRVATVVARNGLSRGQILKAADLRIEARDSAGLPATYLSRIEDAVGQSLRRSVPAGAVLNPAVLDLPRAVRRGERVTLIAGSTGVTVKSEGEALEDAALDARLRVRTASGRIVEGTVGPDNQVFIGAAPRGSAAD
jgi:flagella basal body P-ring formation protein FlgA